MLTNQDVDRLAESDREQRGTGQLIQVPPVRSSRASDSRPTRDDRASDGEYDVSDVKPPSYNGRASSWQEEYYRLKAIALKRALERGEAIHFGDEAPPPGSSIAEPVAKTEYSSPSCLYHSNGELLHAPEGVNCRADRSVPASPAANASTSKTSPHNTCLYGIRGKVLYKPAGRDCD